MFYWTQMIFSFNLMMTVLETNLPRTEHVKEVHECGRALSNLPNELQLRQSDHEIVLEASAFHHNGSNNHNSW